MARVSEISIEVGVSVDKGGMWLKPTAGLRVLLDPEDDFEQCYIRAKELVDEKIGDLMKTYGVVSEEGDR